MSVYDVIEKMSGLEVACFILALLLFFVYGGDDVIDEDEIAEMEVVKLGDIFENFYAFFYLFYFIFDIDFIVVFLLFFILFLETEHKRIEAVDEGR